MINLFPIILVGIILFFVAIVALIVSKSQNKKKTISRIAIIATSVLAVCGIVSIALSVNLRSDEKQIIGQWEVSSYTNDADRYEEFGEFTVDRGASLNGITKIRFFKDGTVLVDGHNGSECGNYYIEDKTLRVTGNTSGMFWRYDGFIGTFRIYNGGTTLCINIDDEQLILERVNE